LKGVERFMETSCGFQTTEHTSQGNVTNIEHLF